MAYGYSSGTSLDISGRLTSRKTLSAKLRKCAINSTVHLCCGEQVTVTECHAEDRVISRKRLCCIHRELCY